MHTRACIHIRLLGVFFSNAFLFRRRWSGSRSPYATFTSSAPAGGLYFLSCFSPGRARIREGRSKRCLGDG